MSEDTLDAKFMREAIKWANACHPNKPGIPKVGAIIAVRDKVLGRGRRGTGDLGDDQHAEFNALQQVADKSELAGATLYTTLEPCTPPVRSKPLESCTELILQHQIKKVFVGMLDPNQGVTGKGLWRLQDAGIEVALFPHDLSKEVRAQNAPFIRSQQTLCATIISPTEGQELRTFESGGKYVVRFQSKNPPGSNNYLLVYRGGSYWPQAGPFREVDRGVWEIEAHFGETGDHTLQLVTAGDLAEALVRYYRKIIAQNQNRRERLRGKIDMAILGGDHPGIEMNGLPKGFQLEASVAVTVAYKFRLVSSSVNREAVPRGCPLALTYEIECSENVPHGIWLGASFRDKTNKLFFNTSEDKAVSIVKGQRTYERVFTVAKEATLGEQMLDVSVWRGMVGNSQKSKWIAGGPAIRIEVTD
jgi:pyrimidine deaminase RibD-like protein